MTREDLEEGRTLIERCVYGSEWDSGVKSSYAAEQWLKRHASELLSLAEEARWRKVETEPPPRGVWVLITYQGDSRSFLARLSFAGDWSGRRGDPVSRPGLWRPLPKPPEKP